jgi:hypothetical protein
MEFYRLPAAARIVISAALFFGLLLLMTLLNAVDDHWHGDHGSLTWWLVFAAAGGLLFGILNVVLGDRRIRRIFGSTEQAVEYGRALRTGELPEHIEPDVWFFWLNISRQSNRWTPWGVSLFVVVAVGQSMAHAWAYAAAFTLLVIWLLVSWWVKRGRILRLATALAQRAAATAVGDAEGTDVADQR